MIMYVLWTWWYVAASEGLAAHVTAGVVSLMLMRGTIIGLVPNWLSVLIKP